MNKEEILSKAQKDSDEMEQAVLTKSLGISTIIIPILCLLFIIMRITFAEYMISDLIVIILAQLSISEFYQYFKMKKRIMLILGICTFILAAIFTINFIYEVSLWKKI